MRMPYRKKALTLAVSLAACSMAAVPAQAEESDQVITLEELVVTAQKREQNIQDTPISMTAFNAEALESQGVSNIADVSQYIPNVQITESPGGSTGATIGIRGSVTINPAVTWEPTVGVYVDGVFVAKNVGGLFEVAELERIEVLRGPQGTLYGKNTVGGAINLVSRKPGEEAGGTVKLSAGNYNYTEAFVSVDSGRIGDMAQFNIAVNKRDRDGFYENNSTAALAADEFKVLDSTAARFAALLDLTDDVELYYTYDMSDKENTPSFGQFDPNGARIKRKEVGNLDGTRFDTSESEGHALHLSWDATDNMTVKSITSYREMKFHDYSDYDAHAVPFVPFVIGGTLYAVTQFHAERQFETDQVSQEFQLVGTAGPVDYVVGAYYLNEDTTANNPFHYSGATMQNLYGVKGDSYALFGQADWHIDDAWTLTAGLRWTKETKEAWIQHDDPTDPLYTGTGTYGGSFYVPETEESWDNVSPMMVVSYLWENGINTYFKVSQGWKAGGFNGEAASAAVFVNPYDEEKVTSVELGMKSRWLDNRLQANVAIFQDNTKDMQISHFLGAYSDVRNAGEATVSGLELELLGQVSESVTANLNYGYLDAGYDSFKDAAGVEQKDVQKYRYAPKNTLSLGVEYVKPVAAGELRARLDYSFNDDHYVYDDPANAEATKVEAYGLLNGRVSIADMPVGNGQLLEIGFWGKNLTDEEYRLTGIPVVAVDFGTFDTQVVGGANYYGDPRTFGADLSFKF